MPGAIVAIGGGLIRTRGTAGIDREIIRLSRKRHPKLLFIPTASSDSERYCRRVQEYFGNFLKCKVDLLFLMKLLARYLKQEVPTLHKNNVRLQYIGRLHELPAFVQEKMEWARQETSRNTGMILTLALNYSARSELVDAFHSVIRAAANNGGIEHLQIDEETISRHLYTRHLADPDLVIRTSGEMRLSNFLLWQLAYAEIYVTPTLWPEFRGVHLLEGIAEYQTRERRYGGLNEAQSARGLRS